MPTGGAPLQEPLTRLHSKGGTSPAYYDEDMAAYGEAHTAFRTAMGLNPGATIGLRAKRVTLPHTASTSAAGQVPQPHPNPHPQHSTIALFITIMPQPQPHPCLTPATYSAVHDTRGPELCSVHSVVRGAAAHAGVRH